MSDKKPYQYTYNKKKQDYDDQYARDHYDRFSLKMPKGYKDIIRKAAESQGLPVNKYIQTLVDKAIKED